MHPSDTRSAQLLEGLDRRPRQGALADRDALVWQDLAIRRFPGHGVEAARLRLAAAMIALALLRRHCPRVPILRLVDPLRQGLFEPQTSAEVRALLAPRHASTRPRGRHGHAS